MLAGAAAGIAAIFRAPLAGAVMGLESPYRKNMAHDATLHGLFAAAASYTAYASIQKAEPYFLIPFHYELNPRELLWCLPLGCIAGGTSRLFLGALNWSKRYAKTLPWQGLLPNAIGGILIALIALATTRLLGEPAVLQSGLDVSRSLLAGKFSGAEAGLIFFGKALATIITFAMGGVGGLFLPSATVGAALGAMFDFWIAPGQPGLFTLVGIAAFTGASYNSLLFSAVFVAEASGNPALIVPSLIASGIAYLISLGISNSPSQK
jgi:CIC family chloride channel protein